jgi:hypothetical protein
MAKLPPARHSFFVSVHIPKTAGTTLGTVLNRVFKYRVMMDYPSHVSYSTPDPQIRANTPFVEDFFKGIHGHFNVRRHLPIFPSAKFITTVRHPVERIISQYLHELNDAGADSYFHSEIASGRMSVVDFAEQESIGDGMSRHMDGLKPEDFDLLLISEDMASSINLLNYVIGNMDIPQHFGSPAVFPRENKGTDRNLAVEFDKKTRSAIFARSPKDNEIYRKAVELFAKRVSALT